MLYIYIRSFSNNFWKVSFYIAFTFASGNCHFPHYGNTGKIGLTVDQGYQSRSSAVKFSIGFYINYQKHFFLKGSFFFPYRIYV